MNNNFFYSMVLLACAFISLNAGKETRKRSKKVGMQPGYNQSARIVLNDGDSPSFILKGSFTYWQALQENMELGTITNSTSPLDVVNGELINMNFDFKPGFQIGASVVFSPDDWDVFLGYTWFRGTNFKKVSLDPDNNLSTILPAWQIPSSSQPQYFFGREKWSLHMDFIDGQLGRSFYFGKQLTARPFIGLCTPLIRQKVKVIYNNNIDNFLQTTETTEMFNSWGIGPRGGLFLGWLLGSGFSLYGTGAFDITYTEYTSYSYEQQSIVTGQIQSGTRFKYRQSDLSYLRTHMDLNLGLSWGGYCFNHSTYLLLAADYGFQVFFNQNMFRNYVDDQGLGKNVSPNGNLYLQGLTLTFGFDF